MLQYQVELGNSAKKFDSIRQGFRLDSTSQRAMKNVSEASNMAETVVAEILTIEKIRH